MQANETITLSLTLKKEFGISQFSQVFSTLQRLHCLKGTQSSPQYQQISNHFENRAVLWIK